MATEAKSVLYTGTSSGIGFLSAKTMAARGHTVFAGMRNVSGKNREAAQQLKDFSQDVPGTIHVVEMDVTSCEQVNQAAQFAVETAGKIDVAVNSAGQGGLGWQEEFTIEQFHRVMDSFLYGAQRVYRAVLPFMRKRRSGLIINVTTIGARLTLPLRQGPYTCAKWGLEALSERYNQELESFNIQSITVQPGLFPTKLVANAWSCDNTEVSSQYPPYEEDKYYKSFNKFREKMLATNDQGQTAADVIADLIDMPAEKRPTRSVAWSTNLIGCAEAERMNKLFGEVIDELLQKWVRGRHGDFFAEDSSDS